MARSSVASSSPVTCSVLPNAVTCDTLHVTGEDEATLERAIALFRNEEGLHWQKARPSLEDVFIHLMTNNAEATQ